MTENKILKILCSLPIILLALYFIKFLGIILIILRCFVYKDKKLLQTSIILMLLGIVLLLPNIFNYILGLFNNSIPFIKQIIESDIYSKLLVFAKFLLILSVILIIISFIVKNMVEKVKNVGNEFNNKFKTSAKEYIDEMERKEAEISRQNDLEIKLKQETAKNTHVVYCPNCGADNIIVGNHGKCKYCRSVLKAK